MRISVAVCLAVLTLLSVVHLSVVQLRFRTEIATLSHAALIGPTLGPASNVFVGWEGTCTHGNNQSGWRCPIGGLEGICFETSLLQACTPKTMDATRALRMWLQHGTVPCTCPATGRAITSGAVVLSGQQQYGHDFGHPSAEIPTTSVQARQGERAASQDGMMPTPSQKQAMSGGMAASTVAIVLRVDAIKEGDHCSLKRFTALFELVNSMGWDAIVLQNRGRGVSPFLRKAALSNTKHVHIQTIPEMPSGWWFGKLLKNTKPQGQWKWPLCLWLSQQNYSHAWFIESDVLFNGKTWSTFFKRATQQAGNADLVASFSDPPHRWYWRGSKISGKLPTKNIQTFLPLFRISHRFAKNVVSFANQNLINGHYEALFYPLCVEYFSKLPRGCTANNMHLGDGFVLGGQGLWQNSSAPSNTLRFLASHALNKGLEPSKRLVYPTSKDVPPDDEVYHPVKCGAELANAEFNPPQLAYAMGND